MSDTEAPSDLPLDAGAVLAHYEVESVLGSGGMGTVYLARDTALEQSVALKVLKPRIAEQASLIDRFFREARAAARVNHPNLTHVYFVGTDEGRPFFAMEHCPGGNFEEKVLADGPLSLEEGIDALIQATRGLEAAHGAGVIHRDVKPSNVMLLPDGTVKVTDFGLAKSLSGDVQVTGGGNLMGTPTYISPEQCRGRDVDERTDIYLLGLTAWFLFTGTPAYSSKQLGEVLNDQMNTPLPDLLEVRPDLPPGLAKLLESMCEKDSQKRPATMFQVAGAFEALRPKPLSPAPITARAAAFAMDMAILSIALMAVSAAFAFVEALYLGMLPDYLETLASAAVAFGLLAVVEMRQGTTLGKMLLNLRVARLDGNRPSTRAAVTRFLIRYPATLQALVPPIILPSVAAEKWLSMGAVGLQMLAVAVGFVWYFFSAGRTLSDVVTRTRVVYRFPGSR